MESYISLHKLLYGHSFSIGTKRSQDSHNSLFLEDHWPHHFHITFFFFFQETDEWLIEGRVIWKQHSSDLHIE